MSQSSQSILDHIAEMLQFISNTQSFWFMLDTSYNHGCHLACQFRLDPKEYEGLLIVAGLVSSCHASWLSHCLLSSSHCPALSLSCRASWLLHCLLPSSRCAALSSSCRASWLSHCLSLSSRCATFLSTHCRALLPPSNTTTTAAIERHLYLPLLPQLPSIATVKCQSPPSSMTAVKPDVRRCHPPPLMSSSPFPSPHRRHRQTLPPPLNTSPSATIERRLHCPPPPPPTAIAAATAAATCIVDCLTVVH